MDFISGTNPEAGLKELGLWFVFEKDRLLVKAQVDENDMIIPTAQDLEESGISLTGKQFICSMGESPCYAGAMEGEQALPEGFILKSLRALLAQRHEDLIWRQAGPTSSFTGGRRTTTAAPAAA